MNDYKAWRAILCALAVIVCLLGLEVYADTEANHSARSRYEPEVVAIVELLRLGDLEAALKAADRHVVAFPKSRIGYLLRADILHAMSSTGLSAVLAKSPVVEGLQKQIGARWQHSQAHYAEQMVPASLIELGSHKHIIVADMQHGRLYLYKNVEGVPKLISDYYLTVGSAGFGKSFEGDNKTPIGVYSIYQHLLSRELPDLYGEGAFPVNYPNRYDRSLKRTGYGIWLHGTPSDTYARPPWASEGCFVLSNPDLLEIQQFIDVPGKTPVILSDAIKWVSLEQLSARKKQLLNVLEQWRNDWESLNTEAYLAHYSKDNFNFGQKNFAAWSARKRQVNRAKTFVQVDMDVESLFVYPGEYDMFVVKYKQRYLSNNYSGEVSKQQYWQRNQHGQWKILYEG